MGKDEDKKMITKMCAWCRRIEIDGQWKSVTQEPAENVSHGICSSCLEKLEKEIDAS